METFICYLEATGILLAGIGSLFLILPAFGWLQFRVKDFLDLGRDGDPVGYWEHVLFGFLYIMVYFCIFVLMALLTIGIHEIKQLIC